MEEYKIQMLESLGLVIVLIIILKIFHRIIDKAGVKFSYQQGRIKLVKKVVTVITNIVLLVILALIWGIEPTQLAAYVASLLAVIGIAFLAQWSIASNITATLIIFFNHPVKIGDTMEIMDKDYAIRGKIHDIGIFFIIVKTNEDELVSLPSNVFMQKMVKKAKNTPS